MGHEPDETGHRECCTSSGAIPTRPQGIHGEAALDNVGRRAKAHVGLTSIWGDHDVDEHFEYDLGTGVYVDALKAVIPLDRRFIRGGCGDVCRCPGGMVLEDTHACAKLWTTEA